MSNLKPQYALLALVTSWLTGWIPVTRRVPSHKHKGVYLGILCFVLHNGYYPGVAVFSPANKTWYEGERDVTEFVTHWKSSKAPAILFDEHMINRHVDKRNVL